MCVCQPTLLINLCYRSLPSNAPLRSTIELRFVRDFVNCKVWRLRLYSTVHDMETCVQLLLMEEILHQLIGSLSQKNYRVLYIPGGAGLLPSTVGNLCKCTRWFLPEVSKLIWPSSKTHVFDHNNFNSISTSSCLVVKKCISKNPYMSNSPVTFFFRRRNSGIQRSKSSWSEETGSRFPLVGVQ